MGSNPRTPWDGEATDPWTQTLALFHGKQKPPALFPDVSLQEELGTARVAQVLVVAGWVWRHPALFGILGGAADWFYFSALSQGAGFSHGQWI